MNYAEIKEHDVVNGPGVRATLFVSGCWLDCPGCFNKKVQNFEYGKEFTDEVLEYLMSVCGRKHIAGLSILGGDPFAPENQETVLKVVKTFKERYPEKNIYCWTGYKLEYLARSKKEYTRELLLSVDTLIDGPFIMALKDLKLKLRGSSNQNIIFLSERYREYENDMKNLKNRNIEIMWINDREIFIAGIPYKEREDK